MREVLVITSNKVKNFLLQQLSAYLNHTITKEQFYDLSECFYTDNAKHIKGTEFDKVYLSLIPDACSFYIDEPCSNDTDNEASFKKIIEDAYQQLINL